MKDDRLKKLNIAKSRLKQSILGIYGLECCSLPTAALNMSRFGELTTSSGSAFHWTIANEKKEYL